MKRTEGELTNPGGSTWKTAIKTEVMVAISMIVLSSCAAISNILCVCFCVNWVLVQLQLTPDGKDTFMLADQH